MTASIFAPQLYAQAKPKPVGRSVALEEPYRLMGRLRYFSGVKEDFGTATVVTPKGILSCGHVMYSKKHGFSFEVEFERGRYKNRVLRASIPTSITLLSGYANSVDERGESNPKSFDKDISVLGFKDKLSGGQTLQGRSSLSDLRTKGIEKTSLGYGRDPHNGELLLAVTSVAEWNPIKSSFYKCDDALLEDGMSGGPVVVNLDNGKRPFIAAVCVAGSAIDSGFRVVKDDVLRLIKRNLN